MVANIPFNPYAQTNAPESFNISATGYIQGTAMDDPSTRYRLRGGYLAGDETLPMWGGVGIYEEVPGPANANPPNPQFPYGGKVGRATLLTGAKALTGFSVFDQDYAMINSPQSPVPLQASGGSVHLYPLGSLARIAVACSPNLISLEGGLITQQVSWDFTAQELIPFEAAHAPLAISAITWNANVASVVVAVNTLTTGGYVTISGSDIAAYNGDWGPITVVDTTHFTFAMPLDADPGDATTGQVDAGGGALPCKILRVSAEGNMIVMRDPTTGFVNWNRNGAAALIQI